MIRGWSDPEVMQKVTKKSDGTSPIDKNYILLVETGDSAFGNANVQISCRQESETSFVDNDDFIETYNFKNVTIDPRTYVKARVPMIS